MLVSDDTWKLPHNPDVLPLTTLPITYSDFKRTAHSFASDETLPFAVASCLAFDRISEVIDMIAVELTITPADFEEARKVIDVKNPKTALLLPKGEKDRIHLLCTALSLMETSQGYSAQHRSGLRALAHLLNIPWTHVAELERQVLEHIILQESAVRPVDFTPQSNAVLRGWTIAGFTVLGAGILTFAGVLVYPMVITTMALVGKATAVPAITAGVATASVGIAGATIKTTALAVFGLTGAGLGAYRAVRRTAGCYDFRFHRITEVEYPSDDVVLDVDGGKGLLVPTRLRNSTARNLFENCEQSYKLSIVIDNRIDTTFELFDSSFEVGCWHYSPIEKIPPHHSAVVIAKNKGYRLSGTSGYLLYKINEKQNLVVYFTSPLIGPLKLGATVLSSTVPLEEAKRRANDAATEDDGFYFDDEYDVKWLGGEHKVVVFERAFQLMRDQSRVVPADECSQCAQDVTSLLSHRRHTVTVLCNASSEVLTLEKLEEFAGSVSIKASVPKTIPAGCGTAFACVNWDYTLGGASIKTVFKVGKGKALIGLWTHVNTFNALWSRGEVKVGSEGVNSFTYPDCPNPILFSGEDGTPYLLSWELDTERCITIFTFAQGKLDVKPVRPSPHVAIAISGFLTVKDPRHSVMDQAGLLWYPHLKAPDVLGLEGAETFYLTWDVENQGHFGRLCNLSVNRELSDRAVRHVVKKGLEKAAETTLHTAVVAASLSVMGAMRIPHYAMWMTEVIDNSFACLQNSAQDAGHQLALALLGGLQGKRPVSLIGYSCGANVILQCLQDLASANAKGLVENVYILGGTITTDQSAWNVIRQTTCCRVVNVYSTKDWFLSLTYRALGANFKPIAGLSRVKSVVGVENVNVSNYVSTHAEYMLKMDDILKFIPTVPTEHTLDPDETTPGITAPLQSSIHEKILALHNGCKAKVQATVAIVNATYFPLKYVAHTFSIGRWELSPPTVIEESYIGTMIAQHRTREAVSVKGYVVYQNEEITLVIWFEQLAQEKAVEYRIALMDKTAVLPDFHSPPETSILQCRTASGTLYELQCQLDEMCIVTLRVPEDEGLEHDIRMMLELDEWNASSKPTDSFQLKTETKEWANKSHLVKQASFAPGRLLSDVDISSVVSSGCAHRIHLVFQNKTEQYHVLFQDEHIIEGRWKFRPAGDVPPGKAFTAGIVPRKVRGEILGEVVLHIVRAEDEVVDSVLVIGFTLSWDDDGIPTARVRLSAPTETLKPLLEGDERDMEGFSSSPGLAERDHLSVCVDPVEGSNAVVCILRTLDLKVAQEGEE
eukprot:PhF_6_TR37442/c0_g1_i1/m.55022